MFPPLLIWHQHYSDGDDDGDDDDYVDDDDEEDDDDDEEQTKEKDEGVLGEPEIGDVRPADCRVHYCWSWTNHHQFIDFNHISSYYHQ